MAMIVVGSISICNMKMISDDISKYLGCYPVEPSAMLAAYGLAPFGLTTNISLLTSITYYHKLALAYVTKTQITSTPPLDTHLPKHQPSHSRSQATTC